MEMMESFPKFMGQNIDFDSWTDGDWGEWLEKLIQLSPETDKIDFNEMQAAFTVNKNSLTTAVITILIGFL